MPSGSSRILPFRPVRRKMVSAMRVFYSYGIQMSRMRFAEGHTLTPTPRLLPGVPIYWAAFPADSIYGDATDKRNFQIQDGKTLSGADEAGGDIHSLSSDTAMVATEKHLRMVSTVSAHNLDYSTAEEVERKVEDAILRVREICKTF